MQHGGSCTQDVSGIPFPVRLQLDFCVALGDYSNLESLFLADVGLGSNPAARQCLDRGGWGAGVETLMKRTVAMDQDQPTNKW